MIRKLVFGCVALGLAVCVIGCGEEAPKAPDAPIKTTEGVAKKGGKGEKTMEVSISDPSLVKKK